MIIKFQIIKSVIVEAVKVTTYLKAKMDGAADDRAIKASFQEAAGDEDAHEQVLTHDFQTALEMVKTILVDYLVPTENSMGNNIIYYNDTKDDIVEFTINASRRCNGTLTDTLARLVSKYVEDYMTSQWWLRTTNQKQAEPYQAYLATDEQSIRRCFVLSGPIFPTIPYTKTLTVKADGSSSTSGDIADGSDGEKTTSSAMTVLLGSETVLSYSIDDNAIDDIEAKSSDTTILKLGRNIEPHCFVMKAFNTGVATITLWSRHSDTLKAVVEVTVERGA